MISLRVMILENHLTFHGNQTLRRVSEPYLHTFPDRALLRAWHARMTNLSFGISDYFMNNGIELGDSR